MILKNTIIAVPTIALLATTFFFIESGNISIREINYIENEKTEIYSNNINNIIGSRSSVCIDPPANLISWTPFDGNADALIGPNGTNFGATVTTGMVDQAYSFSGGFDRVDLGNDDLFKQAFTELSIDAWVRPTQIRANASIISKSEYDGWAMRLRNGQLTADLRLTGGQVVLDAGTVPLNVYSFVAFTYDGSTLRLYIDGVEVGSTSGSGSIKNTRNDDTHVFIGNEPTGSQVHQLTEFDYIGDIDEVEIFDRSLSAQEILDLYNAGPKGKCKIDCQNSSYDIAIDNFSCNQANVGVAIQSLTAVNGCDSTITITTSLLESYSDTIYDSSCNPLDTGLVVQNLTSIEGCDSNIYVQTTLINSYNTSTTQQSCDSNAIGINIINLTSANGCDSTVTVSTIYIANYNDTIYNISCNPLDTGVMTQNFTSANGCDSNYISITALTNGYLVFVNEATCDILQVGIDTLNIISSDNCDSSVIITTLLMEASSDTIYNTSCNPLDTGTIIHNLNSTDGCDSNVVQITSLINGYETLVNEKTCDTFQVGMDTINLISAENCDSTIIITTTLAELYNDSIYEFSCIQTDTTTITQNYSSFNGCDSIITLILDFSVDSCLKECSLVFPTAFTPNSDLVNDLFLAINPCSLDLSSFQLTIYNRWGESIFISNDIMKGWSGIYKGEKCLIDVYTYIVRYQFQGSISEQLNKGVVTLIR